MNIVLIFLLLLRTFSGWLVFVFVRSLSRRDLCFMTVSKNKYIFNKRTFFPNHCVIKILCLLEHVIYVCLKGVYTFVKVTLL